MSEVTNTWSAALEINGAPMNGIEMGEKFMSIIGGSAPKKDYVTNSNETADGVQYDDGDNDALTPKLDERQLTLPFYISGTSQSDFETNKEAFYQVLYAGSVILSVPSRKPNVCYKLKYKSGVEYAESRNGCFAKFSAKFTEPDPTDRTPPSTSSNE